MAKLFDTLKNIGLNLIKPTTGAVDLSSSILKTAGKVLPGAKAAIESLKQSSTEPYKSFLTETSQKYSEPILTKTPEGKLVFNKEQAERVQDIALGFTGAEGGNVLKRLVNESDATKVAKILKDNFKGLARQAVEEYAPKIASSKVATEIEGFLKSAKEIPLTAGEKLINVIKSAKVQNPEISATQTAERSKRATEAIAASTGKSGKAAYYATLSKLKGELAPKETKFGSLIGEDGEQVAKTAGEETQIKLTQNDADRLFDVITAKDLGFWDDLSAKNGLEQLLEGKVPPPSQLSLLEDVFGSDLIKALNDKRTTLQKGVDLTFEILTAVPRALKTTGDFSAMFKQAIPLGLRHPGKWGKASVEAARDMFSEARFNTKLDAMKNSQIYKQMKDSGLYIADPRKLVSGREEYFTSDLAEKIPVIGEVVKASNRAYSSLLNNLRFDVFVDFVKNNPELTKNDLKSLADFINTASGRGSLGKLEQHTSLLSKIFFAPKFVMSKLQFFNPVWYAKQTPIVRKEAAKTMATYLGTVSSLMTLAKMGGADVEIDPRSSNFGKMSVPSDSSINSVIQTIIPSFFGVGTQTFKGKTYYDLTFGFGQYIRLAMQLLKGEKKTQSGRIEELGTGKPFSESRGSVVMTALRGKLAPFLSTILDLAYGKNVVGEDVTLIPESLKAGDLQKSVLIDNVVPLYAQDILDVIKQPGSIFGNDILGTLNNTSLPDIPKLPKLPSLPKLPKLQNLPKIE